MTARHESTLLHFQSFYLSSLRQSANRVWKGMWVAFVSKIWNHRNNVAFKDGVVDEEEIFSLA